MSPLVTHGDPAVHSRGWPPATPSPGRHARGPGSSSGSALWPASASGSPLCSPCGRPVSSSTAGAAHCGGPGETIASSSDTYVVFASSSAGILQPPIMRASTPDRDVRRRRAEENEETFIGSFWKKTPPKKTTVSHRWNDYTFRSVMAACTLVSLRNRAQARHDTELSAVAGEAQIQGFVLAETARQARAQGSYRRIGRGHRGDEAKESALRLPTDCRSGGSGFRCPRRQTPGPARAGEALPTESRLRRSVLADIPRSQQGQPLERRPVSL